MVLDLGPLLYTILAVYVILGMSLCLIVGWAGHRLYRLVLRHRGELEAAKLKNAYGLLPRPHS